MDPSDWLPLPPPPGSTPHHGGCTMSKQYERRRAKSDPKGDRRSRSISPDPAPVAGIILERQELGLLDQDAIYSLQWLLTRGDGWVRLTSTLDMKTVYAKYKWTSGNNRGKYVMAVGTVDQMAWVLCLLRHKALEVDRGERSPSQDTFYDWKE